MLISKSKFLGYQNLFYKKIMKVPYKISLEVVVVQKHDPVEEFSMDAFVGDSLRTSTTHEFRALYEKDIPNRTREKYGLSKEVNGIVYLSPKQLVPVYGDYHVNWNRTKVHFEGRTQVVDKVIYLEEFKEYGSCIGIQIFVKDALRGG